MTERRLEGIRGLVRERLHKENLSESELTGFTEDQIAGAILAASHDISKHCPYQRKFVVKRAIAADTDYVVDAEDISAWAGSDETATIAAQPDVPRNITLLITDADTGISAFTITVAGTDRDDEAITEEFTFSGGLSQTGTEKFKTITSVTCSAMTGAGAADTLDIGLGVSVNPSRELDLTSIYLNSASAVVDLLDVNYNVIRVRFAECPMWNNPPRYRNVKQLTNSIYRLGMSSDPAYDRNIALYCNCLHEITTQTTTLPQHLEMALVACACWKLCFDKGQEYDNKVGLGSAASDRMKASGWNFWKEYDDQTRAHTRQEVVYTYSED